MAISACISVWCSSKLVAIMEASRAIDRTREARGARRTGGLPPPALALALFDWSFHLASAPGKLLDLLDKAVRKSLRLSNYLHAASFQADAPLCIEPLPGDYRFKGEAWDKQQIGRASCRERGCR